VADPADQARIDAVVDVLLDDGHGLGCPDRECPADVTAGRILAALAELDERTPTRG
jgi:hypothetical protein